MDPITMTVVAALAAGAAAGLTDVATAAVKDAYQALKSKLLHRKPDAAEAVARVEDAADSPQRQQALATALGDDAVDDEVAALAEALSAEIAKLDRERAPGYLVDLMEDMRGKAIVFERIRTTGGVVKARSMISDGEIRFVDIESTGGTEGK